jgi:hypothetical protein
VVPLLVIAGLLAACAAVLGGTAGLAVLLMAAAVLLGASVAAARANWSAAVAEGAVPVGSPVLPTARDAVPGDALTTLLQRLQEETAEKVNLALDDGREDLARELSDAYADEALREITAAGLPPAAPRA